MADSCAKQKRPDNSRKRHNKGGNACLPHSVDVRFDSGDKHQNIAADLRQQQQRAGRVAILEEMKAQEIEIPGPKKTPTINSPRMGGMAKRPHTDAAIFTAGSKIASSSAS